MQAVLKEFPSDDVSGETLQAVREMIQDYEALQARGKKVIEQIDALLAKIKDPDTRRGGPAPAQRDRPRTELRHPRPHGGLSAKRRRAQHAGRRQAGAGHQRLAAGAGRGHHRS